MSDPHLLTIRVYYEDTDFSGVVYHASYLRFLERGRTELLRGFGIHQAALHGGESEAFAFAVRSMTIEFLKPARMDDLVTVETLVEAVRGASIMLKQKILLGEAVLIHADVRVAAVVGGKPARLPPLLKAKLAGMPIN
jgi:acyl-CoA thioester hydrolase